jgi:hypothetical protein
MPAGVTRAAECKQTATAVAVFILVEPLDPRLHGDDARDCERHFFSSACWLIFTSARDFSVAT